jgi:predicted nucleotidyltransferase
MHRSTLADHAQVLLHRIRDTIRSIEPAARIILYGSRARGDARPDSDWDLLILLNGAVDHHRAATVHHRLYDLELESDTMLSTMVLSNAAWENPLSRAMPFYTNVMGEGIEL